MLDALPYCSAKYGSIASTTAGEHWVVALLSKYTTFILRLLYAERSIHRFLQRFFDKIFERTRRARTAVAHAG